MDQNPLTWKPNDTPKSFFNPLEHKVVIERLSDENKQETFVLHPVKICTYPTYLSDFLIKHLVDIIINEKHSGYVSPEKRLEIQSEITI